MKLLCTSSMTVLILLVVGPSAGAQQADSFELVFEAGDRFGYIMHSRLELLEASLNGRVMPGGGCNEEFKRFLIEVLQVDGKGRIMEMRVFCVEWIKKSQAFGGGSLAEFPSPIQGALFRWERVAQPDENDDGLRLHVEGGSIPESARPVLRGELDFNRYRSFLPTGPVRKGATWTLANSSSFARLLVPNGQGKIVCTYEGKNEGGGSAESIGMATTLNGRIENRQPSIDVYAQLEGTLRYDRAHRKILSSTVEGKVLHSASMTDPEGRTRRYLAKNKVVLELSFQF